MSEPSPGIAALRRIMVDNPKMIFFASRIEALGKEMVAAGLNEEARIALPASMLGYSIGNGAREAGEKDAIDAGLDLAREIMEDSAIDAFHWKRGK